MRLPAELRQLIVEEIVADNATVTSDCRNHDLWSLASTSNEWYSVAQPTLFRQLELLFDDTRLYQWEKLKDVIDGRPSLLEHVRGLVITVGGGQSRIFCLPAYGQGRSITREPSIDEMRRFKVVFPSTLATVLALPFEQLVLRSAAARPDVDWDDMKDFMHGFLIRVRSKRTLKSLQIEKIHRVDLSFVLGPPGGNLNSIHLDDSTLYLPRSNTGEKATPTTERILNFLSETRSVGDSISTLYTLFPEPSSFELDTLPRLQCRNLRNLYVKIRNRRQVQVVSHMLLSARETLHDLHIGYGVYALDHNLPFKHLKSIQSLTLSAWMPGAIMPKAFVAPATAGLQNVVKFLADIVSIPTLRTLLLTIHLEFKSQEDSSVSTWCKISPFPNIGTILSDALSGVGRESRMETQSSRLREVVITVTVNYTSTAVEISADPSKWVEEVKTHLSASFVGLSDRVDMDFDVRLERTDSEDNED